MVRESLKNTRAPSGIMAQIIFFFLFRDGPNKLILFINYIQVHLSRVNLCRRKTGWVTMK